ncbi:uncharacterized protein J3R85_015444 [Psidium guajava]|nr:uncharacterized protein J3R85_015444 [Psidium guajava]
MKQKTVSQSTAAWIHRGPNCRGRLGPHVLGLLPLWAIPRKERDRTDKSRTGACSDAPRVAPEVTESDENRGVLSFS